MPNQNKIHTLNNLGNGLLFFLIELMIIFDIRISQPWSEISPLGLIDRIIMLKHLCIKIELHSYLNVITAMKHIL